MHLDISLTVSLYSMLCAGIWFRLLLLFNVVCGYLVLAYYYSNVVCGYLLFAFYDINVVCGYLVFAYYYSNVVCGKLCVPFMNFMVKFILVVIWRSFAHVLDLLVWRMETMGEQRKTFCHIFIFTFVSSEQAYQKPKLFWWSFFFTFILG